MFRKFCRVEIPNDIGSWHLELHSTAAICRVTLNRLAEHA